MPVKANVVEVFNSIQGEGSRAGRPCLFIRLTGCPLRCTYCDTTYAFHEGVFQELEAILAQVRATLGPPGRGPNAPDGDSARSRPAPSWGVRPAHRHGLSAAGRSTAYVPTD